MKAVMRIRGLIGTMAALALTGCGTADAPKAAATPPAPVEAVQVGAAGGAETLTFTGRIERRREIDLSFRVPGVMTRLDVEAGDRVRAGQVVARLDPTGVAAAEQRARADLERVERDMARARTLFDQGFVSKQRLDDSASALKSAQAAVSAAAFDRRWASLVSPVEGVVLTRTAQAGEVVQPGQTVITVADERSGLVLRANAPDRQAGRVKVGDTVRVDLGGGAAAVSGQVVRVGRSASALTAGVEIEVALPPNAQALSGQVASASLAVATEVGAQAARIPAEAILEAKDRGASVLVVDAQGKARRRAVTFEGFEGDFARVSGLPPGAKVITAGAGFVSDGQAVLVVDPAKLPAVAAR
jgi:RND family efflux transporter MFP subunit